MGKNLISRILKNLDLLRKRTAKERRFPISSSCPEDDGEPGNWDHYTATFLAAARVDIKTAQERLGHGTIATTADIYMQVSPKMQQEAVEKINNLFRSHLR